MKRLVTLLSAAFLLILPLQAADLGGKVVQIGTDPTYPPHEYIDENTKQVVGFDVDVVVEICKLVNCIPVWNPTAWEGIFPALAQGRWDMVVSGVTITEERDKIVDFSDPYIIVQQGVLMRVEDVGKVTIDTFKSQDIDSARELMGNYKEEISEVSQSIVEGVISGKDDSLSASQAASVVLYSRYLKRIAAHSRNLISSIVNPFERIGYPE